MSDTPITKTLQHRWGHDSDIDVEEILGSHEQMERGLNQAKTRIKVFESTMYSNAYEMEQLTLRHAAVTAERDQLLDALKTAFPWVDDLEDFDKVRAALEAVKGGRP